MTPDARDVLNRYARRSHNETADEERRRLEAIQSETASLLADGEMEIGEKDRCWIALDTETARYDGKTISQLAAVKIDTFTGEVVGRFNEYVRPPGNEHDDFNIDLTGITPEDTANADSISKVWSKFGEWAGDTNCLVAHNAPFDLGALKVACEADSGGDDFGDWIYTDSKLMAKATFDRERSYKLVDLMPDLEASGAAHTADADAEACARLVKQMFHNTGARTPVELSALSCVAVGKVSGDKRSDPDNDWEVLKNPMPFKNQRKHQHTAPKMKYWQPDPF